MARYGRLLTDAQLAKIQPLLPNDPSARAGVVSLLKIQSAFESYKLSAVVC